MSARVLGTLSLPVPTAHTNSSDHGHMRSRDGNDMLEEACLENFFFYLERHVMPHDAERNVSNSPEAIFYLDLFFLVFFF